MASSGFFASSGGSLVAVGSGPYVSAQTVSLFPKIYPTPIYTAPTKPTVINTRLPLPTQPLAPSSPTPIPTIGIGDAPPPGGSPTGPTTGAGTGSTGTTDT